MNTYYKRKIAEVAGTLLILFPCIFLLAWEDRIADLPVYWGIMLVTSATFGAALFISEKRRNQLTAKRIIGKYLGYIFMFICILVKFVSFFR